MQKKFKSLPNHIGIILDGNGRWATKRGLPRSLGHSAGVEAVRNTVNNAIDLNLKVISLYAFSTENWKRGTEEIEHIFNLLRDYLIKNSDEFVKKNVKIIASGEINKFPKDLYEALNDNIEKSKQNTGLVLNLCLNYGGKDEIIRAINLLLDEKKSNIKFEDLKEKLYTSSLPDPDLIIRTSGEQRLSNFMPIQSIYSELYFPSVMWPDFNMRQLKKALKVYAKRNRRFGNV